MENIQKRKYKNRAETVSAEIASRIEDGTFAKNSFLPTTIELADIFQVSKDTISQAMSILASDNLIVRCKGKGTRVIGKEIKKLTADTPLDFGIYLPMLNNNYQNLKLDESPVWFNIFNGAMARATELGCRLIPISCEISKLKDYLSLYKFAGVIFPLRQDIIDELLFSDCFSKTTILFADQVFGLNNINYICEFDDKSSANIINFLWDKGFRRIAAIGTSSNNYASNYSWRGYQNALSQLNVYNPSYEKRFNTNATKDDYMQAVKELLSLKDKPDVICVYRACHAEGILDAVKSFGLKVPEDISLCVLNYSPSDDSENSFDKWAKFTLPSKYELGMQIIDQLQNIVTTKDIKVINKVLNWQWYEGETLKSFNNK